MAQQTGQAAGPPEKESGNSSYTLGAEIELQILDRDTMNLTSKVQEVLAELPEELQANVTSELFQSAVEVRSGVCGSVKALEEDLLRICWQVGDLAEEKGLMLYAAGLHPFARAEEQLPTDKEHVPEYLEKLQFAGRQFIAQGLHIHVGLNDRKTAVKVCNAIQAYLPLLLAASVSSPFFQGRDTGFMSYRTALYEILPTAGIYGYQENWRALRSDARQLIEMGLIKEVSDLQWDARLNLEFGTIEVRICDVPCRFSHIVALAACVQCLVASLAELEDDFGPLSHTLLKANKWQAARYGLQGMYMDPAGVLINKQMHMHQALAVLFDELVPMSVRLGCRESLNGLHHILEEGPGAERQLHLYKVHGDFQEMITTVHQEFWG